MGARDPGGAFTPKTNCSSRQYDPPPHTHTHHHHHHVQRCSPLDFSAHGCGGHKLRAQLPFVCLLLLRLMLPFLAPMWTNQASPRTACMFNVEQLHLSNFSFSQMCSLGGQPRERCTKLDFLAKFLCYGKMRMLMMSSAHWARWWWWWWWWQERREGGHLACGANCRGGGWVQEQQEQWAAEAQLFQASRTTAPPPHNFATAKFHNSTTKYRVVFHWYPQKRLKYGKPSFDEAMLT